MNCGKTHVVEVDQCLACEVQRLRDVLAKLAGDGCDNFTSGPGSCWSEPGRSPDAQYTAEKWCVNCIALAALLPRRAREEKGRAVQLESSRAAVSPPTESRE